MAGNIGLPARLAFIAGYRKTGLGAALKVLSTIVPAHYEARC